MKKHFFAISIATLLLFGCSNNETELIQEANLTLNYSKMIKELVDNEDFRAYFNTKSKNSSAARYKSNDNKGNGVMFIENGQGAFWGIGLRNDNDTPDDPDDDYTEKVVFLGGNSSDIKIFKNGRATAQSSTNNAYCFVIDFSDFSFLRNECYDTKGHFNLKLDGTIGVDEAPWGTVYFIDGGSTFLHANNITINNESRTYDDDTGELLYCHGDATVEKSVSLKLVGDGSGPLEGRVSIE